MARPVVGADTEEFYASLGHLTDGDAERDWPLLRYLNAPGSQLQVIDDLGRDDAYGRPGWSVLLDINRAPSSAYGYIAQYVGVKTIVGLSDADQKLRITTVAGQRRGSPASIIAAPAPWLTGTKRVDLFEREGGAYKFRVRTFSTETTDAVAVLAALVAQKPAGLVMTYEVPHGMTYAELDAHFTTYANMAASGLTYDQLSNLVPP